MPMLLKTSASINRNNEPMWEYVWQKKLQIPCLRATNNYEMRASILNIQLQRAVTILKCWNLAAFNFLYSVRQLTWESKDTEQREYKNFPP